MEIIRNKINELEVKLLQLKGKKSTPSSRILKGKIKVLKEVLTKINNENIKRPKI